jgi:glycosyltransferase involved in cell wall biosynthesis
LKLIIQIPCLNEEESLGEVLSKLPQAIEGIDEIQVLIVDDGSTDNTLEVAREHGVQNFLIFKQNRGLAAAFRAGIQESLRLGADVIVNTDGDNQYDPSSIHEIVRPVIDRHADMVIGDRETSKIKEFKSHKRGLQVLGSRVISILSGANVPEAAQKLILTSKFTYTLESIIVGADSGLRITSVPIKRNHTTRPSRLFKSNFEYVRRNAISISRIYTQLRPYKVFMIAASFSLFLATISSIPSIAGIVSGSTNLHQRSLIFSAVCMISSLQLFIFAYLADAINALRSITSELLVAQRRSNKYD